MLVSYNLKGIKFLVPVSISFFVSPPPVPNGKEEEEEEEEK